MFKKFIAFTLALISFSSFANTKQEFSNLINEFNYSLTVEWDQVDQVQLENRMSEFRKKLEVLKASGLDEQTVQDVFKEKSLSPHTSKQIEFLVSRGKLKTSEEILNYVQQNPHLFSMSGASWNGEAMVKVFWVTGIILVTTAVILLLNSLANDQVDGDTCREYSETRICSIPKECVAYDEMKNCIAWKEAVCQFVCLSYY